MGKYTITKKELEDKIAEYVEENNQQFQKIKSLNDTITNLMFQLENKDKEINKLKFQIRIHLENKNKEIDRLKFQIKIHEELEKEINGKHRKN